MTNPPGEKWEDRYTRVFGNRPYFSTRKFINEELGRARAQGADILIFALATERRRKGMVTFSRLGYLAMAALFWSVGHIAHGWWPIIGLPIGVGVTWIKVYDYTTIRTLLFLFFFRVCRLWTDSGYPPFIRIIL